MAKGVRRLLREQSGVAAAEYALILAIVGAVIAIAAFALGGSLSTSLDSTRDRIAAGG